MSTPKDGEWVLVPREQGGYEVRASLPCINGLSAWFTFARIEQPDEAACGYTDGAAMAVFDTLVSHLSAAPPAPTNQTVQDEVREALEGLIRARDRLIPLGQQCEDRVWRPAKAAVKAINKLVATLTPTKPEGN